MAGKKKAVEEKKVTEGKPNIISRIDSVIVDIRKQADEEVNKLQTVKQVEISKAVFTFEEIEKIHASLVERCECGDYIHVSSRYYDRIAGIGILFDEITRIAEIKI